jgi:hypothetical protein
MIEVENRGAPAVVLVTRPFLEDAKLTAEAFGMPGLRLAIMDVDAITNLDKEDIHKASDALYRQVIDGLFRAEAIESPVVEARPVQYALEKFSGTDKFEAWEEFNRVFLEKGWGDGFPLIPPTEEKVEEMLRGTKRIPDEVITALEPGMGMATVKIIAINAVMAGCQPGHMPVIIAALKAMSKPEYRLRTVAMSTGPHAPMLVVNGPIAKELRLNSGRGALGPGRDSWSNTVLGRAIRLLLMNVGHAYVGEMDLDTLGSPIKYSMCIAENEGDSPWEPYHVSQGYRREDSTVTVFGVESQFEIYDFKNYTPEGILTTYAHTVNSVGALSTRSWLNPRRRADNAVLICPDHAVAMAKAGWEKEDVQAYLYAKAQLPAKAYKNTEIPERIKRGWRWIVDAPDDMLLPIAGAPDWFHVIVVGGPAGKSSYTSGVGKAIIEKIEL